MLAPGMAMRPGMMDGAVVHGARGVRPHITAAAAAAAACDHFSASLFLHLISVIAHQA